MGSMIRENKQQMSDLYTKIANQIAGELPKDWTNMSVGFLVDESGFDTYLIYYSTDCGKSYRDFMEEVFDMDEPAEGVFEAKETCLELREVCKKSRDVWTGFALRVNRLGEFSADFSYEPIESFTPMQLRFWRGRYLK